MKRSTDRILTTHVGSLPRPRELADLMRAVGSGRPYDSLKRAELVKAAVAAAVQKQAACGIDVVNDGEMGKPGFINYANERIGGFEVAPPLGKSQWAGTRETLAFPEFYEAESRVTDDRQRMICTGPITYKPGPIQEDLRLLKEAAKGLGVADIFVTSVSPSLLARFNRNAYYGSNEEYVAAIADALRQEYSAIIDAGFLLQIDDPGMLSQYLRNPSLEMSEWRKWAEQHVEALNHALRGIPSDKIRHHTCHGINMGPRVHEMEFKDHIDLVLRVNAGAYSFEAANPRHEHEWKLWQTIKLPEGKVIIPGVVTQSTVLVEHPELVADRIERFASVVGRENVIASTDCGFASNAGSTEIHETVVWAKLKALSEGARLASERLWKPARVSRYA